MGDAHNYYRDKRIISAILKYCGVNPLAAENLIIDYKNWGPLTDSRNLVETCLNEMKAVYLVGFKENIGGWGKHFLSVPKFSLGWLLDIEADIFRVKLSDNAIISVLDVEYVNKNDSGHIYRNQVDTYWKIEAMHQAIKEVYSWFGISPLVTATGQGYHYTFMIRKNTKAYKLLQEVGGYIEDDEWFSTHVARLARGERPVGADETMAFNGLGRLQEWISALAVPLAYKYGNSLQPTLGDVKVPDNETISIDLSSYGGTLHMRDIRVPFSTHQKHKIPGKVDHDTAANTPIQIAIPRTLPDGFELSLDDLFRLRRSFVDAPYYADSISTEIPIMEWGVEKLVYEYKKSDMGKLHHTFDDWSTNVIHDDDIHAQCGYDHPEIIKFANEPNPFLLRPTNIAHIVRVLAGEKGWHPRDISNWIAGKYRVHNMDIDWSRYAPTKWAEQWVRGYWTFFKLGLLDYTIYND